MCRPDVLGPGSVDLDTIQSDLQWVVNVQAQQRNLPGRCNEDVLKSNVPKVRRLGAPLGAIERVHHNRVLNISDANIAVQDLMHKAAATRVRLDAQAIVGAVDRKVSDFDSAHSAISLASDRHAMPRIEMIMGDGDVGCGSGCSRLDGDIVIAAPDV